MSTIESKDEEMFWRCPGWETPLWKDSSWIRIKDEKEKISWIEDVGKRSENNSKKPLHPTSITTEILMFLARNNDKGITHGQGFYMLSVQQVFRVGTSMDLQRRFMSRLITKGLVDGCTCGCRGDYEITNQGLQFLADDCLCGEIEFDRIMGNKRC